MYTDLDEIQHKIRDAFVRRLYLEALGSFRAGSLRGATVTLWTAVVFDILAKLRELELAGDAQAAAHLQRFEAARNSNDLDAALRFEREVLDVARDQFELISHQEHGDLVRLHEDRHRCAHPSMNSADEPYMPSGELVRYHLSSAGLHLFSRPPVQGKAALARLFDEVRSPYFPRRVADAARVLQAGALANAKASLVRNFVVASMKACLIGPDAADIRLTNAILVSLAASNTFLAADIARIVSDTFPRIAQQIPPDDVGRIFRLAAAIPAVLEHLPEDVASRLEAYIEAVPEKEINAALTVALAHPRFSEPANTKLASLKRSELVALVAQQPTRAGRSVPIVNRVLDAYCASKSWDTSNTLGPQAVAPIADALDWPQVVRLLEAVAENSELHNAFTTHEVLLKVRDSHPEWAAQFNAVGNRLELGRHFAELFPESAIPEATEEGGEEPAF